MGGKLPPRWVSAFVLDPLGGGSLAMRIAHTLIPLAILAGITASAASLSV